VHAFVTHRPDAVLRASGQGKAGVDFARLCLDPSACFARPGAGSGMPTTEETRPIRRPMRVAPPVQKDGPRVNQEIRVREVQLIDQDGNNRGVTATHEAIALAQAAGLDLVEISPNTNPPVCKILDYGKFKYQAQKKAAEARKKQKTVEVKEIKLRPGIDIHDYEVKMRSIRRFFEEGDKVKITLRFRGREMAHQDLGYKLLDRLRDDVAGIAKVELAPMSEGRQIVMILAPR
jgi:translation initiation factor IF-3